MKAKTAVVILACAFVMFVLYTLDKAIHSPADAVRTDAERIVLNQQILTLCQNNPNKCVGGFVTWEGTTNFSILVPSCIECFYQVDVVKFVAEKNRGAVLEKVDHIILPDDHAWQQMALLYPKQFTLLPTRNNGGKVVIPAKPTVTQI